MVDLLIALMRGVVVLELRWHRLGVQSSGFVLMLLSSGLIHADGNSIDKVYHPYVQLLEKEVEYRVMYDQDSADSDRGRQIHRLGYGQSLTERWFTEFYLIGEKGPDEGFEIEAYEAELKWQLTEQGEFDNDWGLLVEIEKETPESVWEAGLTLITLHEWPSWIATGNLSLIYEWGSGVDDELETAFSGQLRYRHQEYLEPAIEFYQSDGTQGLGPVLTGLYRLGGGNKLNWELGVIWGTDSETPDANYKFNLEFEFK